MIKIDHNAGTISSAIGLSDKDLHELAEKMTDIQIKSLTGVLERRSHTVEEILKNFSYKELVYLSSAYIIEVIEKIPDKNLIIEIVGENLNEDELD